MSSSDKKAIQRENEPAMVEVDSQARVAIGNNKLKNSSVAGF